MEKRKLIDKHLLSRILSERLPDSDWDSFSPADWESIVHLARAEGVGPLLYWALSRSGRIQLLPEPLQASLRAMYFSTRMNNEQIIQELRTLTSLFDRAGIPVVALKGICFALTVYPDIGLRPMADLDLLVPASKLPAAIRIVKSLGYVDGPPEAFPGLRGLLGDEINLQKTHAPFTQLELHNSLLVNKSFTYAAPVDWFWEQAEPLCSSLSQPKLETLRMLTPNAQLLYGAAHIMLKHGGREATLRWLYDLDCLIRFYAERGRMDWDLILQQARAFQWSSALDAALSQTQGYFNSPIPSKVLAHLSGARDQHRNLIAQKQAKPATRILEEYQELLTRKWYGRVILILGLLAPSPAYMRWRYGLKTYRALPLWYLYRWWGIFKDAIYTVIR
jgi:hypothetical protein